MGEFLWQAEFIYVQNGLQTLNIWRSLVSAVYEYSDICFHESARAANINDM